jgi:putative DNA primase/helicase
MNETVLDRALGRWPDIYRQLGVPERLLTCRQGPCPWCGGKTRFRFGRSTDPEYGQRGGWYCNHCGHGFGIDFVMRWCKLDMPEALHLVEGLIDGTRKIACETKQTTDGLIAKVQRIWSASCGPDNSILVDAGDDCVRRYLQQRGIEWSPLLKDIRQTPRGNMAVLLRDPDGRPCQLQFTHLTREGRKQEVARPREYLVGKIAPGAAVRLMNYNGTLGIAEGTETALSATLLYGVPCWAALDAGLMRKWSPPKDAARVIVFGDNDINYTGQAAAYHLANRIAIERQIAVDVIIPENEGTDWNDELKMRLRPRLVASA